MVKTVTELALLTDFPWAGVSLHRTFHADTLLLGYYRDGVPTGLAVVNRREKYTEIVDIFHNAWGECVDICYNALLGAAMDLSEEWNLPISFSVALDREDYRRVDAMLSARGFLRDIDKRTILCVADEATRSWLEAFLAGQGSVLLGRLARKGYTSFPYNGLSSAQRERVRLSTERDFQRVADIDQLRLPMDGDSSFFTFDGEELIAFCVVTRASDNQLVYDFMAVGEGYKNTGVFLMPLIAFIEHALTYERTQSIVFVYSVENREMTSLMAHALSPLIRGDRTKALYYHA